MLINGSNESRKNIDASYLNFSDESTGDIYFNTTVMGNSPHLYYIFCKTEILRAEFNTMACYVTVDIHRYIYREVRVE